MDEFLLAFVKIGLITFASYFGLAIACGVVFSSYFNAKKKYMKEMNDIDQNHGS